MTGTRRERERAVALDAVRRAARLCRSVAASIPGQSVAKRDRTPVTVADFGSQAVICDALRRAFPEDPVLAEEDAALLADPANAALAARVAAEVAAAGGPASLDEVREILSRGNADPSVGRFWVLDPIDGTKGFLRRGQYAIALALVEDGALVAAVLGCPSLPAGVEGAPAGVAFVAEAGGGTREVSLDDVSLERPVHASDRREPARLRLCESLEAEHAAHGDAEAVASRLGLVEPSRRLDSQAKYGLLARGEADLYLRMPRSASHVEKSWDHAAGALVVAEAGGRVTDLSGRALDFTRGRELTANRGIVATNGRVHDEVLAVVAALGLA